MSGSESRLGRWRERVRNSFSPSKERSSISRPSTPSQSALSVQSVQRRAPSNPPPSSRSSSVHQARLQDTSTDTASPRSKSDLVLDGLKTTLGFLKEALADIPLPGKGAIDVAIHIIVIAQTVKGNSEQLKVLNDHCGEIGRTIVAALRGKSEENISKHLKDSLDRLASGLQAAKDQIASLQSSRAVAVVGADAQQSTIQDVNTEVKRLLDIFMFGSVITASLGMEEIRKMLQGKASSECGILNKLDREALRNRLEGLPRVPASYDSYRDFQHPSPIYDPQQRLPICDTGTRTELLHQIAEWMCNPDQEQIYILTGVAGKGKSTVCRTAAACAAQLGALGASFFFSRGENGLNTAKTFFSTITYQLAYHRADFMNAIGDALESSPDAPSKALHIQLAALLLDPLGALCPKGAAPTVIVIDALDECQESESATILRLFLEEIRHLPSVKVLITTRPDPHIIDTVRADRYTALHRYQDISKFDADHDIKLFLRNRLAISNVQRELPSLRLEWGSSEHDIDDLARNAGALFIVAATSVRFILDCRANNPMHRLSVLLQMFHDSGTDIGNPYHLLDALYRQILESAIPAEGCYQDMIEGFQHVVGAIIVLQDPLTRSALGELLGMGVGDLDAVLRCLHSVTIPASDGEPLRVYHASFPDFIIDRKRCKRDELVIHPAVHHLRIASLCFRVMQSALRRNICELQGSERYEKNCDIPNIAERVEKKITPQLAYSCRYWANHLAKGGEVNGELLKQLNDFVFTHFLHWLEVLSLIGKMGSAYEALEHVQRMKIIGADERLQQMLHDCQRFIMRFHETMAHSCLHIYYSVLPFTPTRTKIFETYAGTALDRVHVRGHREPTWSPLLVVMTLMSTKEFVLEVEVMFSPDGRRITSRSGKLAQLWDGSTGKHVSTLEGHSGRISSMAFSPDSHCVSG